MENVGTVLEKQEEKDYKGYIALLSVVSAVAVVILHTNGCFWSFSREGYWFGANVIESLCYFAVPVFFMISGATLIDYRDRYSTKEFFVKRLQKAGIPFLAWSLIGMIYFMAVTHTGLTDKGISYWINGIIGNPFISIYWFFLSLFCVYLCMPLLSAVPKENRKSVFAYIAVAAFLINHLIPFGLDIVAPDIVWKLNVSVGGEYLLYVIVGYLLSEYGISKRGEAVVYLCAGLGLLAHMAGTYVLSMRADTLVQTLKGYNNVPCIMYSVGVFLFFRNHGNKIMDTGMGRVINALSSYTFAIYLMHYYIMRYMEDLFVNELSIPLTSLVYRLGAPVLIIAIVIGIAFVLRKLPLLGKIVP